MSIKIQQSYQDTMFTLSTYHIVSVMFIVNHSNKLNRNGQSFFIDRMLLESIFQ